MRGVSRGKGADISLVEMEESEAEREEKLAKAFRKCLRDIDAEVQKLADWAKKKKHEKGD